MEKKRFCEPWIGSAYAGTGPALSGAGFVCRLASNPRVETPTDEILAAARGGKPARRRHGSGRQRSPAQARRRRPYLGSRRGSAQMWLQATRGATTWASTGPDRPLLWLGSSTIHMRLDFRPQGRLSPPHLSWEADGDARISLEADGQTKSSHRGAVEVRDTILRVGAGGDHRGGPVVAQ